MVCRKFLLLLGALVVSCCASTLQAADVSVSALVKQLSAEDPAARQKALVALGASGDTSDAVVTAVVKAVGDANLGVRRAAIGALRELNAPQEKTLPLLIKVLESAPPEVAISIVAVMAEAGEAVVPRVITALEHPEARYWAALVVHDMGPKAKGAVGAVVEALADAKEPEVRRELVLALGAIGPDAKAAVPALIKLVSDKDPAIVVAATYSLGQIGPNAAAAGEVLKKGMSSKDDFLRVVSAWALAATHPDDKAIEKAVVPVLVAGLVDDDERGVRHAAAQAIVQLAPDHDVILPAVLKACENTSPELMMEAVQALAGVGRDAVPGLARLLKHEAVRPLVAQVLGQLGSKANAAVPAMIEVLPGSDDVAKGELLFAFGKMGEGAAPAVPAIAQQLASEEEDVRYAAIYALAQIGPAARDARRAIVKAMESDDEVLRTLSASALVQIDPQGSETAKEVLPHLIEALKNDEPLVQIDVAHTLAMMKKLAKPALPALKELAASKNADVAEAAKSAIKSIE